MDAALIKDLGNFVATDGDGFQFKKHVLLKYDHRLCKIISFGGHIQYYAKDLIKHFPFTKPFCIDVGGSLHKNSSVFISAIDMNHILSAYLVHEHKL